MFNLSKNITSEIRVQSQLDHPNIVKLFGYFSEGGDFYLIEELALGRELFHELKSAPYKKFTES